MMSLLLDPNNMGMIAGIVVGLNILLSGISKILEMIKDKTATQADNKAFDIINKIVHALAKVIDWVAPRTAKKD